MRKHDKYANYMTPEDRALAKKENSSFRLFIIAFLMMLVYASIAFFDVWKLRDSLPLILIQLFPGTDGGNPTRLYTALSIIIGGLAYFITIMVLWFQLARPEQSVWRRLATLAIWCAGAAAVYLLLNAATTLVI